MWPISPPAPCAPSMTLPLTMTPPPTPVPSVTMTALRQPLAAPIQISPRAATLASLPTRTLMPPSNAPSSSATLCSPQPPRFAQMMGTMRLSSTGPGTPTPTPSTCSAARPFSCILPRTAAARFSRMCSPALEVSVGTSHLSSSSPLVRNRPILAVVPPRSMPNAYSFMFHLPLFLRSAAAIFHATSIAQPHREEQSHNRFSCNPTESIPLICWKCRILTAPGWSGCRCRRSRNAPCRRA